MRAQRLIDCNPEPDRFEVFKVTYERSRPIRFQAMRFIPHDGRAMS